MQTKTLWVKDEYLRMILDGRKTVEVRVAYSNLARLEPGDRLLLNDQHLYVIERIERYDNFEALLAKEDPAIIAPGMSPQDLLLAMRQLYPAEKEALGVLALHIRPESTAGV